MSDKQTTLSKMHQKIEEIEHRAFIKRMNTMFEEVPGSNGQRIRIKTRQSHFIISESTEHKENNK